MNNFVLEKIKEYAHDKRKAVIYGKESITYKELDEKSDRIAWEIKVRLNGKSNVPIIIYEPRGIDFILYIIAVLKCGCYYIPCEPNVPFERVKTIYEDANAVLIISNNVIVNDRNIYMPKKQPEKTENASFTCPEFSLENVVYIIYTSGTTGRPKGVKILYRNLYNLIQSFDKMLYSQFDTSVNIGVMASFSFDASVKQIYPALYFGHTLVIAGDKVRNFGRMIHEFHNNYELTVCDCTPSHLKLMTKQNVNVCSQIKYLLVGGENLTWRILKEYRDKHAYMPQIINVYGPTECCVDASYYVVGNDLNQEGSVPIGTPLEHTELWIVDEKGKKIHTQFEPGELWIEGAQVGGGYINMESDVFIKDKNNVNIIYRTGDLAMYTETGDIRILSRMDRQTKINGYRIELDEISSVMETYTKSQSYTLQKENVLYGFITRDTDRNGLKDYMVANMPVYMIPKKIIFVKKIPLTYNGKVDEKKLLSIIE